MLRETNARTESCSTTVSFMCALGHKSIDFAVTRFLMKLFRTSSIDCRTNFSFMLPSEMIEIRKAKFEIKFNTCNSLRYYFGL